MKKEYTNPELSVLRIEDVITASLEFDKSEA